VRKLAVALALAVAVALAVAGALAAVMPTAAVGATSRVAAGAATAPNDPGFAGCESEDPVTGCTDNEQWDLFGPLTGNTCLAPGGSAGDQPHPDGGLPSGRAAPPTRSTRRGST
jgi:hypothetical protein